MIHEKTSSIKPRSKRRSQPLESIDHIKRPRENNLRDRGVTIKTVALASFLTFYSRAGAQQHAALIMTHVVQGSIAQVVF
ncbi:hypothetical protein EVAR_41318_1 [Eumeta japonica]|uniref:Uncharacterized protein n=1 Tax=Eumeta variegata TaxID=151549 RepID=A0A4C1X5E6_EUMVA|nr:hypothetical protein EVAR_41318_1 [Eumeta japonica]